MRFELKPHKSEATVAQRQPPVLTDLHLRDEMYGYTRAQWMCRWKEAEMLVANARFCVG